MSCPLIILSMAAGFAAGLIVRITPQIQAKREAVAKLTTADASATLFTLVWRYILVRIYQYFNKSVVHEEGRRYIVRYVLNGRIYAIRVQSLHGPEASRWTEFERGSKSVLIETSDEEYEEE